MRDYNYFDQYYEELTKDVYAQPDDPEHTRMAGEIIAKWIPDLDDVMTVLDVGCGTGFCEQYFRYYDRAWLGVAIDVDSSHPPIIQMDFNFTGFGKDFCDLVFSRHSLEHSPFPLITLMEWHRISKKYLLLVVPNPAYYTYFGRNHYAVMNIRQIRWLLRRAGWHIEKRDYSEPKEFRFLCTKRPRLSSEGYVEKLDEETYKADRDDSVEKERKEHG